MSYLKSARRLSARTAFLASSFTIASYIPLATPSLAGDIFGCDDLIRHMQTARLDTAEAQAPFGWFARLEELEVTAPDGKSVKIERDYRIKAELSIGSALQATISFVARKSDASRSSERATIRSRFISPAPMLIEGKRVRCTDELIGKFPLNSTVNFRLLLDDAEDVRNSKGTWRFVAYTESRRVINFAEFDLAPIPSRHEKDVRWLASAYENYLLLDKCVDLYAASLTKHEYRTAMAAIEAEAKKRNVDTESVWKKANEESKSVLQMWSGFVATRASLTYDQRSSIRDLCGSASRVLIGRAQEIQSTGLTPKKDF